MSHACHTCLVSRKPLFETRGPPHRRAGREVSEEPRERRGCADREEELGPRLQAVTAGAAHSLRFWRNFPTMGGERIKFPTRF